MNDTMTESTMSFSAGLATRKLEFTILRYRTMPCLKLELLGCPLSGKLCLLSCDNYVMLYALIQFSTMSTIKIQNNESTPAT